MSGIDFFLDSPSRVQGVYVERRETTLGWNSMATDGRPVKTGYLDTIPLGKCTLAYIQNRWGAGDYRLMALDFRSQVLAQKSIKISGVPINPPHAAIALGENDIAYPMGTTEEEIKEHLRKLWMEAKEELKRLGKEAEELNALHKREKGEWMEERRRHEREMRRAEEVMERLTETSTELAARFQKQMWIRVVGYSALAFAAGAAVCRFVF